MRMQRPVRPLFDYGNDLIMAVAGEATNDST
jgi:hypothetical protein